MLVRPTLSKCVEIGVRDGSSVKRSYSEDGPRTARKIRVPWAEQNAAVIRYLGQQELIGSGPLVSGLSRLTPAPEPNNSRMVCSGVESIVGFNPRPDGPSNTGLSDGSIGAIYKYADIELAYKVVPYTAVDDADLPGWPDNEWQRYTSIGNPTASSEYLSMPGGMVQYIRSDELDGPSNLPGGLKIPYNVGKVMPTIEIPVTWHKLPYDVFNVWSPGPWFQRIFGKADGSTEPYIGSVNSTDFLGFRAGSLLLSDVKIEQKKSEIGEFLWDITFIFGYSSSRWNFKYYHNLDHTKAGWYFTGRGSTYYAPGSGSLPDNYSYYNERDFRDLFRVYGV